MTHQADPSRPIRTVLEALGLVAVAFVLSLVVGVAFLVPLFVLGYDIESTLVLVGSVAVGQAAFLVLAYAYVRWRSISVPISAPSRSDVLTMVVGTVAALVVAVVLSGLLNVLDLVPESVIDEVAADDPTFFLALAVLSVVLIAPAEELLFRGAIQGRLRQKMGPVGAIVGSSLLFGSMHLANYGGAPVSIVAGALLIAAVGAVLGTVYEVTDNLAAPVVVHATYNVVLLVVAYGLA
jgi:membrane protease YdiL (CAAX protease family)